MDGDGAGSWEAPAHVADALSRIHLNQAASGSSESRWQNGQESFSAGSQSSVTASGSTARRPQDTRSPTRRSATGNKLAYVPCKFWLMGKCSNGPQLCSFVHPPESFEATTEYAYWDKVAEIFGVSRKGKEIGWQNDPAHTMRQKCIAYNEKSVLVKAQTDFVIEILLAECRLSSDRRHYSQDEFRQMQKHMADLLYKQDYYRAQCEVLRRLASNQAFEANNLHRSESVLDLHSLNVAEAVAKFDYFLQRARAKQLDACRVITGKPRTPDGISHLGLAVRAFCMRTNVACEPDPTNLGCLIVYPQRDADPDVASLTTGASRA